MRREDRARIFRSYEAMRLIHFSPSHTRQDIQDKVAKFRDENRLERTATEIKFHNILVSLCVKFKFEIPIPVNGHLYFIDFLIGEPYWIAVELDGSVHNGREGYDCTRDIGIMGITGWTVIRFKNEEIGTTAPELLTGAMREILPVEKLLGNFPPKGHERALRLSIAKNERAQMISSR